MGGLWVAAASIGLFSSAASAQPANDLCANAQAIGEGLFPFNNTTAETDAGAVICVGEDFTGSDVWFSYTPSRTGRAIFDTCASDFDTLLTILDECGGLELACSNNQCGLQSRVAYDVVLGTAYIVRVAGYFGATGAGALRIAFQAGITNDLCANATPVGEGTFNFNTDGAQTDGSATCAGGGSADVWFRYTPSNTGLATIQTCSPATNLDTILSVHSSCEEGELICNDDACSGASRVRLVVQAGVGYLVRIAGFDGAVGSGVLGISLATPPGSCIGQPPGSIPEGEACGAASNNGCDGPGAGFTALSCGSSTIFGSEFANATGSDVDWYRITLPGPATLNLSLQADFPATLRLTSGACPVSTLSSANAPTRCADTAVIMATLSPGTYAIAVEMLGPVAAPCGTANNYVLTVATSNCTPMGACCATAGCSLMTAAECAAAGGRYLGDGAACTTTVLDPVFTSTDPVTPIPDVDSDTGLPGEANISIVIAGTGQLVPQTGLAVSVGITHSSAGDVRLILSSDFSGTGFLDQIGFTGDNARDDSDFAGVYRFFDAAPGDIWAAAAAAGSGQAIPPGDYRPRSLGGGESSLDFSFAGFPLDGTWTLTAGDFGVGGTGTIDSFAIAFTRTDSNCDAPPCAADFNDDGFVDPDDLSDFITCFFLDVQFPGVCPGADFNGDGFRDPDDLSDFITAFFLGC